MSDLYSPELMFYADATLLEGPVWNQSRKSVLVVSIEQNCIYLFNIENYIVKTYYVQGQIGCAVFIDNDTILAATYSGIYKIDVESGKEEFVIQIIDDATLRYNDGKLDTKGRFIVGTTGYNCYAEKKNFLYSLESGVYKVLIKGVSISNGIAFSLDDKYMYYIDTPTRKVQRYLYQIESGEINLGEDIIRIEDGSLPDGMCTDIDDMLWIAHWGGSKVSKWNPYTGTKIMEIELPCKNVTSCCVGGTNKEYLFVTTAKHDDGSESESMAGGLFRILLR